MPGVLYCMGKASTIVCPRDPPLGTDVGVPFSWAPGISAPGRCVANTMCIPLLPYLGNSLKKPEELSSLFYFLFPCHEGMLAMLHPDSQSPHNSPGNFDGSPCGEGSKNHLLVGKNLVTPEYYGARQRANTLLPQDRQGPGQSTVS